MKIMSFNTQHCLNYLEGRIDFHVMADAVKACGADIVALNEMRGKGTDPEYEDQVPALAQITGLPHFYFAKAIDVGGSNPYGNGLLSRYPITQACTIPIPDPVGQPCESRCILKARLECGLTVLVTHFGLSAKEQENAARTVAENLEDTRCILMGDFNVTPDNRVLAPIRARMKDAADLFGAPLLSFPSDEPRIKIDYIFVSPDIELVSADIPPIVASDHRPHTAEINEGN